MAVFQNFSLVRNFRHPKLFLAFRRTKGNLSRTFRRIQTRMPRLSAKLRRRKKELKELKKELDSLSGKPFPPRGCPPKVIASEVAGRANNYRGIFEQVWTDLWPLLSKAATEQEVDDAFQVGAKTYYRKSDIWPLPLVLSILNDPKFPKTTDAQVNFFADSLAGLGDITPRYSRDICAKERARKKREHHILRFEFRIECSCGFKGFSRDHACPKCKTQIPLPWNSPFTM